MASASASASAAPTSATGGAPLPAGGLRRCLLRPALLLRWFTSRRFRHAVEVRKHVWKIRCFQYDALAPNARANIDEGIRTYDRLLESNPSVEALAAGLKELDVCAQKWLQPYANAAIRENVEVFLVAIGVAMAIRTFILQPFKIPTGSMQPTLFGLHFEDLRHRPEVPVPGFLGRVYEGVVHGQFYHEIVAEADGEILGIEPRRSILLVNYQDIRLRYLDAASGRTYDKTERVWFAPVDGHEGDLRNGLRGFVGWDRPDSFLPVVVGQRFKKGEVLLRMRDSAGDHLFVDRLTYNFRPPKRGEIIVFETTGIQNLTQDQFYIKRLVGLPGETLRLGDDRHLIVNGQRLDQSTRHFEKVYGTTNAPADSQFSGHVNGTVARQLNKDPRVFAYFPSANTEYRIPDRRYMVMGDNTLNSYDSRGWGDFPQTNVVGKYCFVFWPFTGRWGTRAE